MIPGNYNFPPQYRGDTFDAVVMNIKDRATQIGIDISGATIKCQFREPFNGKIIQELTDGNGVTILDAVNGQIMIDEFEITWNAGVYNYDIQVTFNTGTIKTYVKGTVSVEGDTTNG